MWLLTTQSDFNQVHSTLCNPESFDVYTLLFTIKYSLGEQETAPKLLNGSV